MAGVKKKKTEIGAFTKPTGPMSKTERPMTAREIAESQRKQKTVKKKKPQKGK